MVLFAEIGEVSSLNIRRVMRRRFATDRSASRQKAEMTTSSRNACSSSSCTTTSIADSYETKANNVCSDLDYDEVTVAKSERFVYRKNFPLMSFAFLVLLLFFSSSFDFAEGRFQPMNVTFVGPGSRYMRAKDGQMSRVTVEIVLNISEDIAVGSPISYLQAFDKKPGDLTGTNYSFQIAHESDIYRQFEVGDKDGVLRVAKPLDRESIPSYRLYIKAIDESGNEGYTVININLGDVNDNAPYLLVNQRFIIWENESPAYIGTVFAKDPDGPGNGGPFYMSQAENSTYKDLIKVDFYQNLDNGNGAINVSSIKTLDREGDQGDFLYVPIFVKDAKGLSAIRYLPIEIGDKNDNPMTDGSSTIHVYNYKGQLPDTVIGRVYVTDLDDWDVVDKTFKLSTANNPDPHFSVTTDGLIFMASGLGMGTYPLIVNVHDNVKNEDAIGNVQVKVEYIDDEAIKNAGSMRIRGLTAARFLRPMNYSSSPYERMRTLMQGYFKVTNENQVRIFSVLPVPPIEMPPIIDVYFSVLDDQNKYLSPVFLTGVIEQNRVELEASMLVSNVQIIQVNIDPCLLEMCTEGGCTRLISVNATPAVVMANRTSLVGVNLNVASECQCPREILQAQCTSDSCFNGGICHNVPSSNFFCECRSAYNNGSRCQGKSRTFHENSYAWLKPIGSCDNFSLSLEFMTQKTDNALLLYNGPMLDPRPYDVYVPDFIAIQLISGKLVVQVNLGATTTNFTLNSTTSINDGKWHVVDIIAQSREFQVILDRCSSVTSPNPNNKDALQNCRISGVVSGSNEQLNVDDPLQLGGIAAINGQQLQTFTKSSFVGCIRNLLVNGEIYDLTGVVSQQNSDLGCTYTNTACYTSGVPYCVHGECVANMLSTGPPKCICEVGWFGDMCDQESTWKTFSGQAFVEYAFANSLPQSYNKMSFLIVPQNTNPSYLVYGINQTTFIDTQVGGSNAQFDYKPIGNGLPYDVHTQSGVITTSGYAFLIEAERMWTYSKISIDGLTNPYANYRVGAHDENGWVPLNQQSMVLGAKSTQVGANSNFLGCMRQFTYNDANIPIADSNQIATAKTQQGVSSGCAAFLTCAGGAISCGAPLVCVDFWKGAFCTCPANLGPTFKEDGTLSGCGASVAALHLGITRGAIAAILISLLALILLVLLLVVSSRRRKKPDDSGNNLISNVRGYNEEGGGEQDQHNYNIGPLRKPVIPNVAVETVLPVGRELKSRGPKIDPGNLDDYLKDRLADVDDDLVGPPYDELRIYAVEDDGVSVVSLSSLESAGSDIDWDDLDDWGPRFKNLAHMYGGGADDE